MRVTVRHHPTQGFGSLHRSGSGGRSVMTEPQNTDVDFWYRLAERSLRTAPIGRRFNIPIVDIVVLSDFSGSPDNVAVWIVVPDESDRGRVTPVQSSVVDFVRELLVAGGYPAAAL